VGKGGLICFYMLVLSDSCPGESHPGKSRMAYWNSQSKSTDPVTNLCKL